MLVTFSCPAHADVTMFGDIATRLINMMGHSGTVPSALVAADVPAALQRLSTRLAAEEPPVAPPKDINDDDEEPAIALRVRAGPLLELLEAANTTKCNVMWRQG